jgi:catechol 2,3-dioxygenase-like lactoylglutathione lyase family enzyme
MNSFARLGSAALVVASLVAAVGGSGVTGAGRLAEAPAVAPVSVPAREAAPGRVARIGMTVSNLERSVEFYTGVLGFEKEREFEVDGDAAEHLAGVFGARCRVARLRLGADELELTEYLAPRGKAMPAGSRSNDRWFQHVALVVTDMDRAYALLRAHGVRHASSGPQTLPAWNANAGGIAAFYFEDPDGHVLEFIHFPAGKGDPKWQGAHEGLVLGIDHTAIVVADTDRSIAFYGDALGMVVAGASENYGPEQERLNNVFGARLRITSLRSAAGPGVELLEYLAPADGRDYPIDARACDLVHWQTTLSVSDVDGAAARVRHAGGRWVSPGSVAGVERVVDAPRAALVRDPDGHAVLLAESRRASGQ